MQGSCILTGVEVLMLEGWITYADREVQRQADGAKVGACKREPRSGEEVLH